MSKKERAAHLLVVIGFATMVSGGLKLLDIGLVDWQYHRMFVAIALGFAMVMVGGILFWMEYRSRRLSPEAKAALAEYGKAHDAYLEKRIKRETRRIR